MKNLLKTFALAAFIVALSLTIHAQNPLKIGFIDLEQLVAVMPATDSINKKLENDSKFLEDRLKNMIQEYQSKVNDFETNADSWSQMIQKTKKDEISDLQSRIEPFRQKATQDLQDEQKQLFGPIYLKAKIAISEVAKENKYTYIINSMEQIMLYAEPSDDIMPLVKKKLGIQ